MVLRMCLFPLWFIVNIFSDRMWSLAGFDPVIEVPFSCVGHARRYMAADFGLDYRKHTSLQEMWLGEKLLPIKNYPSVKPHRLFVLGYVAHSI